MKIGIHLPNRELASDEHYSLAGLGGHDYLIYDAPPRGRDWGYWKQVIGKIKSCDPQACIHIRLENRGDLPGLGDAATQIEAAWFAIGTMADTYRFGNEPDLERPGVGVTAYANWMKALHQLIPAGIPFYLPALSGAASGLWFDACGAILQSAAEKRGSWAGWDAHCYGNVGEFSTQLDKYEQRYDGPLLVTEFNYGPGQGRQFGDWAQEQLPLILDRALQATVEGLIYYIWEWHGPDISYWPTEADVASNPALAAAITEINKRSLPAPSPADRISRYVESASKPPLAKHATLYNEWANTPENTGPKIGGEGAARFNSHRVALEIYDRTIYDLGFPQERRAPALQKLIAEVKQAEVNLARAIGRLEEWRG